MKNLVAAVALSISALISVGAQAAPLVIDTSATWVSSVNNGWGGSGQGLTVDAVQNTLVSIGFYFDDESLGRSFDFRLSDAANGGSILFSTSFVVSSGLNVINVNETLVPSSQVFALMDYNGFSGRTAHFQNDVYAGGNSMFDSFGGFNGFSNFQFLDHRFVAVFDGEVAPTPEPEGLAVMGLALTGLALARKLRTV